MDVSILDIPIPDFSVLDFSVFSISIMDISDSQGIHEPQREAGTAGAQGATWNGTIRDFGRTLFKHWGQAGLLTVASRGGLEPPLVSSHFLLDH